MGKVREGDRAPEFELEGTGGRTYRLSDHRGRWVVLAFYPGDFTPVCTRQFCAYRDESAQLAGLDVDLLGISPQGVDSHERFRAEHGLTMPLLADGGAEVARAYGVRGPRGMVRRATFIIDPEGIIRHAERSLLGLTFTGVDEIAERLGAVRLTT
jgi:thioredoxin-dependent peroxiredoxin